MTTIERSFVRNGSHIATLTLEADVVNLTLDGHALSEESVRYLLNFSLQSLQDAYSGATDHDDAVERFETKLQRLVTGQIGSGGGSRIDAVTAAAREFAEAVIQAKPEHKKLANSLKLIKGKGAAERRYELLDQFIEERPAIREAAETKIAAERALLATL